MFRDDHQVCDAVRVLLSSVRVEHLWTDSGPTEQALNLMADRGGPLSHGEALLVLTAFDFWNGRGKVELGELLSVLDCERMKLVASLMIASSQGAVAVDRWIAEHRRTVRREPTPSPRVGGARARHAGIGTKTSAR